MTGTLIFDNGYLAVRAVTGHQYGHPVAEVHVFRGAYIGSRSDYCSIYPEQEAKFGMLLRTDTHPFSDRQATWYPVDTVKYSYHATQFWTSMRPTSNDPILEDVPCPKVRKNVQTRWRHSGYWGSWEKLMSKGWISI
jgi:hypothetical protein